MGRAFARVWDASDHRPMGRAFGRVWDASDHRPMGRAFGRVWDASHHRPMGRAFGPCLRRQWSQTHGSSIWPVSETPVITNVHKGGQTHHHLYIFIYFHLCIFVLPFMANEVFKQNLNQLLYVWCRSVITALFLAQFSLSNVQKGGVNNIIS